MCWRSRVTRTGELVQSWCTVHCRVLLQPCSLIVAGSSDLVQIVVADSDSHDSDTADSATSDSDSASAGTSITARSKSS